MQPAGQEILAQDKIIWGNGWYGRQYWGEKNRTKNKKDEEKNLKLNFLGVEFLVQESEVAKILDLWRNPLATKKIAMLTTTSFLSAMLKVLHWEVLLWCKTWLVKNHYIASQIAPFP